MLPLDTIYNEDCLQGMRRMGDGTVDCIVCDPPYLLENQGGGLWGKQENNDHYTHRLTRKGMDKLGSMKDGITEEVLDEMCRVMKRVNIYIFCSQRQIQQYLDYFVTRRRCNWNLLCWHKSNPIPACGNKYLNDTEYILFFREKGVRIYGSYETKRTYYVTLRNQEDNVRYHHPTVKPLGIVENLIVNSTELGGGSSRPVHRHGHYGSGLHQAGPSLYRLRTGQGLLSDGHGAHRRAAAHAVAVVNYKGTFRLSDSNTMLASALPSVRKVKTATAGLTTN